MSVTFDAVDLIERRLDAVASVFEKATMFDPNITKVEDALREAAMILRGHRDFNLEDYR